MIPSKSGRQVVFITGASSGFGLYSSIEFARKGYTVVASMRDLSKQTELVSRIQQLGLAEQITIVSLDVTDHQNVKTVISEVIKQTGKIDVLINNAGYCLGGSIEETEMEALYKQFETNFFGLVAVTKAVIPQMRLQRSGKIINISSLSGRMGYPMLGPYTASKFAIEGFSESLRMELLPFRIHVVLVEPGAYQTNIWQKGLDLFQLNNEKSPYTDLYLSVTRLSQKKLTAASHPQEVAKKLVSIAESYYPTLRYPMGRFAKLGLVMKGMIPYKIFEKLVIRMISRN